MVQVETIRNNEIKGLNPINVLNDCDSYDFFYYESEEGSKGNFETYLKRFKRIKVG